MVDPYQSRRSDVRAEGVDETRETWISAMYTPIFSSGFRDIGSERLRDVGKEDPLGLGQGRAAADDETLEEVEESPVATRVTKEDLVCEGFPEGTTVTTLEVGEPSTLYLVCL